MKEGMIYQLFAKACRESGCAIKPSNDLDVIYKFTELIVKECAKIAGQEQMYNERHEIPVNIEQSVLEHFGIEE